MTITRRRFLQGLGAAGAFAAAPTVFLRAVTSASGALASPADGTLVSIFLRGAMDGLSCLVPYDESRYYDLRPDVSIPADQVIDLDGRFGMHPVMSPLTDLWTNGDLAFVPASGSPHPSRSHFDAQDFMELGTPGDKSTSDGWVARHLASQDDGGTSFEALTIGKAPSLQLRGYDPALGITGVDGFAIEGYGHDPEQIEFTLDIFYAGSEGDLVEDAGRQTLTLLDEFQESDLPGGPPPPAYGPSPLGNDLWQVAQLVNADLGVEAATLDFGGWDLHNDMGTHDAGAMRDQLGALAGALRAFADDTADKKVTVVVMSEFGRRAFQNASLGTDHGHGNVMIVHGNGVAGGVHGEWPGLDVLDRGDVQVVNDYRVVTGEVLDRVFGNGANLDTVFPGFPIDPAGYVGVTA